MPKEKERKRALIVIDLQIDFCPGGSLAVRGGDEILPTVNRIIGRYPLVAATRDWHPAGHVSFASSHPGRRPFDVVESDGQAETLWPDHCIQGSPGAEFHPQLDVRPIDLILHKGTSLMLDSYSAFFENDHETPTGLEYYLRGFACTELHFCGLATDVCVRASVLDALRLGFRCTIITDAMRGVDLPAGAARDAVAEMVRAGAVAMSAGELVL